MPGVSREQIKRAKSIGIEDYIIGNEPNNVRRVGNAYYLKDHDSLEISNGLWNWHSRGFGGKNVIDYLVKVRGYGFVDAVRHLTGEYYSVANSVIPKARPPAVVKPPERKPFALPPRNKDNERVIAYLQTRGIDKDLILDCIARGLLYESKPYHNCVFVGRDESGKARFAAMRGTRGDFKRDADGSDKRFSFCLPPDNPQSNTLFVFESPIDLLSYDTLCKLGFIEARDGWRLSLGGTAMSALTHFIEQHKFNNPITHCVVCTDRDTAGNSAFSEIREKLTVNVSRLIPVGKDWNETLQRIRNEVNPLKDVRKDIRFIDSGYKTLFTIKDGDSIKLTSGYDGEAKTLKCRFIDEAHITLIGKYHNDYHICQFAEIMERNGSKYEPIPNQKPKLDILAAKYGEELQHAEIPMTEAAINKIVGGKYEVEPLYVDGQGINANYGPQVRGALLYGKNGVAVCGFEKDTLTSLHPYWAQKYKRELGVIEHHAPDSHDETVKKPSLLGGLDKAKMEADAHNAANRAGRNKLENASCL
jgi:hypothetical protein